MTLPAIPAAAKKSRHSSVASLPLESCQALQQRVGDDVLLLDADLVDDQVGEARVAVSRPDWGMRPGWAPAREAFRVQVLPLLPVPLFLEDSLL